MYKSRFQEIIPIIKVIPTVSQKSSKFRENFSNRDRFGIFRRTLKICQCFGIIPLKIHSKEQSLNSNRDLSFKRNSVLFGISIFTLILAIIYFLFQLTSIIISFKSGHSLFDILVQSMYVVSVVLPLSVNFMFIIKGLEIAQIFNNWKSIEKIIGVSKNESPTWVKYQARFLYLCHFGFGFGGALFMMWHSYFVPNYPAYPLYYFQGSAGFNGAGFVPNSQVQNHFSTFLLIVNYVPESFIVLWISCAHTVFEIILSLLSYRIIETIEFLQLKLDSQLDSPKQKHGQNPILDEILRNIQIISKFIGEINKLFGPLLLIYIGQTVLLICVLIFVAIRFLSEVTQGHVKPDPQFLILIYGIAFYFGFRLVLLILSLGSLDSQMTRFNLHFAKWTWASEEVGISENLSRTLMCLIGCCNDSLGLSAWSFFAIKKRTFLSLASLIVTYSAILYQTKI